MVRTSNIAEDAVNIKKQETATVCFFDRISLYGPGYPGTM